MAPENTIHAEFEAGVIAHQGGRPGDAEAHYRQVLALKPDHAEAWHNLGVLLYRQSQDEPHEAQRLDEAEACYRRALALKPNWALVYNNLGVLLRHKGQLAQAETCFRRALETMPDYADAHANLGGTLYSEKHFGEAEHHFRQALALNPDRVDVHNNLGALLLKVGRLPEAEACIQRALALDPEYEDAHRNHGTWLWEMKRYDEAERIYRKLLEREPDSVATLTALGGVLRDGKRFAEAERIFHRVLELQADQADVHNDLGVLLWKTQRYDEAEAIYRELLEREPDSGDARRNLAGLLWEMKRYDEAEAVYRELLEREPDSVEILGMLGAMLHDGRQFPEAERMLRRALKLLPEYRLATFCLSKVLLTTGRLKEGWGLYESRTVSYKRENWQGIPDWADDAGFEQITLPFREWQGESLQGKSLVVYPEQGHGDVIQFVRYLPMLKARGLARLTLVCPANLTRLLSSVEGIDECIPTSDAPRMPVHDYACLLLSLPLRFGTTLDSIPDDVPYLKVADELVGRWKARLPPDGFKVGLVWAGDPRPHWVKANVVDRRRSLHATAYLPLLRLPGVRFVSLQKGETTQAQILEIPEELRPLDVMDEVEDFADTAAIIESLDLVITVDTSVAHVAGALNKPVWILSRFDGCWRWLADRNDSPWYPSARLFRQIRPGDWSVPLEQVLNELQLLAPRKEKGKHINKGGMLPGNAMVQKNMADMEFGAGVIAHRGGRPGDAEAHYRRVLALKPDHAEAWHNLGVLLYRQSQDEPHEAQHLDEAETCYRRALALKPNWALVHNNLGVLLRHKGQLAQAETCFRRALETMPDYADAHANLGGTLYSEKHFDEAEHHFRQALALNPDRADVHNNLGGLLIKVGRLPEAKASIQRALTLNPAYSAARHNLGTLLWEMQRYDEAAAVYRELLEREPDSVKTLTALGGMLRDGRRLAEAESVLRSALALQPGHPLAVFCLSLVLLTMGQMEEGWQLHEKRWRGSTTNRADEQEMPSRPTLLFREWQGESLKGKSLLVWPEGGYGDVFHFVRYLPMLKALGLAKLTLGCPAGLIRLLSSVEGVDACIAIEGIDEHITINDARQIPAHDYACSLLSLPLRFGTTLKNIPANVPYIRVPDTLIAHWKTRLPSGGFKVGLVWSGAPRPHRPSADNYDQRRSLRATAYLPLLQLPGVTFVSLQKGEAAHAQVLELPEELRPLDLMNEVEDFADTAAIIENLDLVITVDTSVAHLAGALNKPVWILSRFDGDWRWLADRSDSPWYPSARLFWQAQPGDWSVPLEQVLSELQTLLQASMH